MSSKKTACPPLPAFLDLAGRDNTTVKIELNAPQTGPNATPTSAPTTSASATSTAPVVETEPPSRTGLWISLAVTGGLVVGTAVVGGLALAAQGDAQNTLNKFGATADEIQSARSKTQTMALVADILGGTALAMTAVTIIIGVTGSKSSTTAKASLLPTPKSTQLGLGPGKIVLQGSF
ncbi:MAG: hypothetical protein IPK82_05885 [Polyangiaceae bacterium]|nr:hypothetical protein [Polyangiaceae bacterium]